MSAELGPRPEQLHIGERAKKFFDDKVEVISVSKEEFLEMVKLKNPQTPDEEILQTKGINFDLEGRTIILLRTDMFPDQYLPYMATHELWEAYIARKDGFNLFKKSMNDYKKDKDIDSLQEETWQEYLKDISVYNYDFRHEYAVFKEYKHAQADGKLDEYHKWLMGLREREKQDASPSTLQLIENDTKIRTSIYKKLTEHGKHYFQRQ